MINIKICKQPDDETCGPTSLHAIYHYYGKTISLRQVISEVKRAESGGTYCSYLGEHALSNGFNATIYVNNTTIFDPSWFTNTKASNEMLLKKLKAQRELKKSSKLTIVSRGFESFLEAGGSIRFKTLDTHFFKAYFASNIPILTGLNATYLYRTRRECYTQDGHSFFDDIQGEPTGHFVVLCGYTEKKRQVLVADPFKEAPLCSDQDQHYKVSISRLINAILLGVVTYDANILILEPE